MLVSVLIPCHNKGEYISRCINSIIGQTHRNIQIVVIDDGSDDDSISTIKRLALEDSRIEYYCQNCRGVADARNTALKYARGEAIMFVDADDWIEPNTIEILLHHIVDKDLDFCACSMVRDSDRGSTPMPVTCKTLELLNQQEAKFSFLFSDSFMGSVCNKLITRKSIGELEFESGWKYAEDAMFMWRLLHRVRRCGQMSEVLYHYSQIQDSLTESLYNDSHLTYITMWENICRDVATENPRWLNMAKGKTGNAIASVIYDIARSEVNRPEVVKELEKKLRVCFRHMLNWRVFCGRYVAFGFVAMHCRSVASTLARIQSELTHMNRI